MLTLADIDRLTNSHDGSIYSDLYKDVYGFRPRGQMAQFVSLHDFDRVYKTLSEILDEYLPDNQQIDFLTIDTEGFDLMILQGKSLT